MNNTFVDPAVSRSIHINQAWAFYMAQIFGYNKKQDKVNPPSQHKHPT